MFENLQVPLLWSPLALWLRDLLKSRGPSGPWAGEWRPSQNPSLSTYNRVGECSSTKRQLSHRSTLQPLGGRLVRRLWLDFMVNMCYSTCMHKFEMETMEIIHFNKWTVNFNILQCLHTIYRNASTMAVGTPVLVGWVRRVVRPRPKSEVFMLEGGLKRGDTQRCLNMEIIAHIFRHSIPVLYSVVHMKSNIYSLSSRARDRRSNPGSFCHLYTADQHSVKWVWLSDC